MTPHQHVALVKLAFSLAPDPRKAVIAGGFAADSSKAQDVDLWMLSDPFLYDTSAFLVESKVGVETKVRNYDDLLSHVRSTATVETGLLPIHVIGTMCATVDELLGTFDISTHRWGVIYTGFKVNGKGATQPWMPGKVLSYSYPESTDARRQKLEARYDIKISPYAGKKESAA